MKKKKLRLLVYVFSILAICGGTFAICFSDWYKIYNTRKEIDTLKNEYEDLVTTQDKLSEDVVKLQDYEYAAKYAREKYLYTKEGELIIDLSKNKKD